jgi:hypothetical protein
LTFPSYFRFVAFNHFSLLPPLHHEEIKLLFLIEHACQLNKKTKQNKPSNDQNLILPYVL